MVTKEKYCPIKLDVATYQKIRYISKGQGKYSTDFMAELFNNLIQLCSTFNTSKFNLEYAIELFPEPKLTIYAKGQCSLIIGEVPSEEELEKLRKQRFDEVALSIAEINGKNIREKEVKLGENKQ